VLAQTLSGLSFVLVERIRVDLGVAAVVDVLRDGVSSSTGHGTEDDEGSRDGSNDDTSDNDTGNNSEEGEAGLLLSLTGGQRV